LTDTIFCRVLEAGKNNKIDTYIVFPSGIYGYSEGPVRALGVIQLLMYEKAKELGFVPYIGEGTSIFNCLHVEDVAAFIPLILSKALEGDIKTSVYERCYILGGKEMQWKTAADAFAKALNTIGVVGSPNARSIQLAEAGKGEIPMLMSTNMRIVGPRAKTAGFHITNETLSEFLDKKGIFPNSQ
jgi:nucleoside-diphosphate-sugar epimerase